VFRRECSQTKVINWKR